MDAAVPVNEGVRPTAKRGRQQREADSKERPTAKRGWGVGEPLQFRAGQDGPIVG